MSGPSHLPWSQPELEAMVVTIHALRVNGKAMSLALFRQLPTLEITDDDGEPVPEIEPVGVVRYSTKGGDVWLVMLFKGHLYRCALFPRPFMFHLQMAEQAQRRSALLLKAKDPEGQAKERQAEVDAEMAKHHVCVRKASVHEAAEKYPQLIIGA